MVVVKRYKSVCVTILVRGSRKAYADNEVVESELTPHVNPTNKNTMQKMETAFYLTSETYSWITHDQRLGSNPSAWFYRKEIYYAYNQTIYHKIHKQKQSYAMAQRN